MTDLIRLEHAAYGRAPDRVKVMCDAILHLAMGTLVENAADTGNGPPLDALVPRIAAAVAAIMGDPTVALHPRDNDDLAVLAPDIARLFQVAGFDGTDFILRALAGDGNASSELLASRLPLLAVDSVINWPPEFLSSLSARDAQLTLAQLISNKPVITMRGQKRRDALLDHALSLSPAEFPRTLDHLALITTAWMLCSYAGSPRKHDIKRVFNRTLRGMADGWGLKDAELAVPRPRKDRPTLLFAAEIIHSRHVQYRYFGQYLRQLRRGFELVLLTEVGEVDDAVRALFDRVLTFERLDRDYLQNIHRMIVETRPDILFYPSVGMRHWGPLFANLRLAPIQITALGHSASSFCETIDYYLLEEGYVSDPALFGETVITVPDESLVFERMPGFVPPAPAIRAKPDVLRIVLPSNVLKLNPGFLATIAKIRAASPRRLEFHLLPNVRGLELGALRLAVRRHLPDARIYGAMNYVRYAGILSESDLNLSPFPFGGLHSVVDSLRQGVPVVAMECLEPHGRTDAMLLRRLGMPEWLIARTEQDYIDASLRIIGDDDLRIALSRQALTANVDNVMFGDGSTPLRSEIVETLDWLYENHERAQADGRKLWSLADRRALAD